MCDTILFFTFVYMEQKEDKLKEVISHAKEYGFVFPSSEIYDGLAATYDYGQLGAELKNNIKQYWWKAMVQLHENIVGCGYFYAPNYLEGFWPRGCI
jgi:glycyl-tRNA synthetase